MMPMSVSMTARVEAGTDDPVGGAVSCVWREGEGGGDVHCGSDFVLGAGWRVRIRRTVVQPV